LGLAGAKMPEVSSASELAFNGLPFDGPWHKLGNFLWRNMRSLAQSRKSSEMKEFRWNSTSKNQRPKFRMRNNAKNPRKLLLLQSPVWGMFKLGIEQELNFYSFFFCPSGRSRKSLNMHSVNVCGANSRVCLINWVQTIRHYRSIWPFSISLHKICLPQGQCRSEPTERGIGIDAFEFWGWCTRIEARRGKI